ncbi:MAG: M48 family metallopeptidase [Nocardioides sp.]
MTDAQSPPPERRVALVTVLVGVAAFVVLAVALVPWHPVPGGRLTLPDPAELFSSAEIARAESYGRWARVWGWGALGVSLVVVVALGLSPWVRGAAGRLPGSWWVRVVLGVAAVTVVVRAATLPLAVAGQVHRRRNGLSTQGWTGWSADQVVGLGLSVLVTAVVLLVVVGCARRWSRAWPAVAGAVLGALVLLGSFAYPVLVEPLFNSFAPLPAGDLRTRVLALADQEGVPVRDVLVSDASRRTTTLNAYVSGFGGTRRIVLYDNLVDDLSEDEALSVVAHELAHARHDDVLAGSSLGVAGALASTGLLGLVLGAASIRRRFGTARVASLPVAVPLLMALVALGGVLSTPAQNTVSRQIETRADVDALMATNDGATFVAMQRQLSRRALSDPTPPRWSQLWFGSHPTTLQRVAIAWRVG